MENKLNYRLHLELIIHKYGWQIPASIVIFTITAFLHFSILQKIEHDLIRLEETIRRTTNNTTERQSSPPNEDHDIILYNKFNDTITNNKNLPDIARTIEGKSISNHVETDAIDYSISPWAESNIQAYRISFPIYGKYVETRKFINDILISNPATALEQIEFSRENTSTEKIKTNVQFVVFTRAENSQ